MLCPDKSLHGKRRGETVKTHNETSHREGHLLVALAGNPNVGKSTIFNSLTGMRQHTGNWAGKTVANAFGSYRKNDRRWLIADLPGCCSLTASAAEETEARDFICFQRPDVIVVVCSAVCLERSLVLALQTLEITGRVVICVNLMDEARRKGIEPELELLERRLGVPVVGTSARSKKGMKSLVRAIEDTAARGDSTPRCPITYPPAIEGAVSRLRPEAEKLSQGICPARWLAMRSVDDIDTDELERHFGGTEGDRILFLRRRDECLRSLEKQSFGRAEICDAISQAAADSAGRICAGAVPPSERAYSQTDRRMDMLLTGRITGWAAMLLLLFAVLWITLVGANYLSAWLSAAFIEAERWVGTVLVNAGFSSFWCGLIADGAFRVLGWVVAVMLPPMAVFFPLFTLLEDAGYLPRVAFNLDGAFRGCGACGKQALTMCMGLGCNAAGVVGCRIIASPRERLVAILTNSFMPCNGRLPMMLTVIALFLAGGENSILSAVILACFIALSVLVTLAVSRLLTATILKGQPSYFSLELPPFRMPQIGRTLVRSLVDRTLTVLGRAVMVAFPAGAVIWLLANVYLGNGSLLAHLTGFLDPVGRIMGLDGITLSAFVLGAPANELVLPIAMMAYSSQGELMEIGSMNSFGQMLSAAGWNWITAVNMLIFTIMHWPCSTTCITVFRETKSIRWTLLAAALPTLCGFVCCAGFTFLARLLCS